MRFSGSRQWREVSRRREILHVSLYSNMHVFLKLKKKIYKNNWLFMGWGTTGTFCLLLEKFWIFQVPTPAAHLAGTPHREPAPVLFQLTAGGWSQALPAARSLLAKREGSSGAQPDQLPGGAMEQPPQQPWPSWPWLPVSRRLKAVDSWRESMLELGVYP